MSTVIGAKYYQGMYLFLRIIRQVIYILLLRFPTLLLFVKDLKIVE